MKKTLFLLSLVLLPAGVFAQGTVQFLNTSGSLMTTNSGPNAALFGQVPNVSGVTTFAGQYRIGLYIAAFGTTDESLFTLVNPTTGNQAGVSNGRFNGGSGFVIPGNNGTAMSFQIRAWQGNAADYESATADGLYRGKSAIGFATPATGIASAPALFSNAPLGAGQVGGFVLTPNVTVPEPSSIALGLLGLGAVAFFRRKK